MLQYCSNDEFRNLFSSTNVLQKQNVMYFIGLNAEQFYFSTVPRYSNIDIPVKMSGNSVKPKNTEAFWKRQKGLHCSVVLENLISVALFWGIFFLFFIVILYLLSCFFIFLFFIFLQWLIQSTWYGLSIQTALKHTKYSFAFTLQTRWNRLSGPGWLNELGHI